MCILIYPVSASWDIEANLSSTATYTGLDHVPGQSFTVSNASLDYLESVMLNTSSIVTSGSYVHRVLVYTANSTGHPQVFLGSSPDFPNVYTGSSYAPQIIPVNVVLSGSSKYVFFIDDYRDDDYYMSIRYYTSSSYSGGNIMMYTVSDGYIATSTADLEFKVNLSVYIPVNTDTITGLSATAVSDDYITWNWTNPVSNYSHLMVYKNGNWVSNVSSPNHNVNFIGLNENTEYTISTRSVSSTGVVNPTWVNSTQMTMNSCGTNEVCQLGTNYSMGMWLDDADEEYGHTLKIHSLNEDYRVKEINSIQMVLLKVGTPDNPCINVYVASGGLPSGSPIGTGCGDKADVPEIEEDLAFTFVLTDPIAIQDNVEYVFTVSGGIDGSNKYYVMGTTSSFPPYGQEVSRYASSWHTNSSRDASFIVQYSVELIPGTQIYWNNNTFYLNEIGNVTVNLTNPSYTWHDYYVKLYRPNGTLETQFEATGALSYPYNWDYNLTLLGNWTVNLTDCWVSCIISETVLDTSVTQVVERPDQYTTNGSIVVESSPIYIGDKINFTTTLIDPNFGDYWYYVKQVWVQNNITVGTYEAINPNWSLIYNWSWVSDYYLPNNYTLYLIGCLNNDCGTNITFDYDTYELLPANVTGTESITNLTAIVVRSNYIKWNWTNPVSNYSSLMVYKNGVWLSNVSGSLNYVDFTGLIENTNYTISTKSVSIDGTVNETWVNASQKTMPECDTDEICQFNITWGYGLSLVDPDMEYGGTFKIHSLDEDYRVKEINSIQMVLQKYGTPDDPCITIYESDGGLPGDIVGSGCGDRDDIPEMESELNFSFILTDPISIQDNVEYIFTVNGGINSSNFYYVLGTSNTFPPYGQEVSRYASSWHTNSSRDPSFVIQYTLELIPSLIVNWDNDTNSINSNAGIVINLTNPSFFWNDYYLKIYGPELTYKTTIELTSDLTYPYNWSYNLSEYGTWYGIVIECTVSCLLLETELGYDTTEVVHNTSGIITIIPDRILIGQLLNFTTNLTEPDYDNYGYYIRTNWSGGVMYDSIDEFWPELVNWSWDTTNLTVGNYTLTIIGCPGYDCGSWVSYGNDTVQLYSLSYDYMPPSPINYGYTNGTTWVTHTWYPGVGNITDSYNVSLNGNWNNGSVSTVANHTVGVGMYSTIRVYAYNNSGNGSLNLTYLGATVFTPYNLTVYQNYSMSDPYLEGSYIKSEYSIDVNLWTNPYFVWGNYLINGKKYVKVCNYLGENIFGCDYISGTYLFNMSYSSYADYNNGTIYYTNSLYVTENHTKPNQYVTKLDKSNREDILGVRLWDYLWIMFILLSIIGTITMFAKRDD